MPFKMHMQGSTCLEGGVYMFNYAGCHECKKKSFVDETEKHKEEEEDGNEESVSYKRRYPMICSVFTLCTSNEKLVLEKLPIT